MNLNRRNICTLAAPALSTLCAALVPRSRLHLIRRHERRPRTLSILTPSQRA